MPSGVLASLFVELRASTSKLNADLRAGEEQCKEFQKILKPLKSLALEVGEAFSVVGDIIAGSLTEAAVKAAEYGAEITRAAQKTGLTTEEISKLSFAASQS